ncbi:MAG: hypothetical protein A2017_16695 [Lentisphaerae bacterium GWF2_44_16]|nr:MAG: hypothetical protein A2017_16695 [Lentisphaerae bacterium GWF2_44_16]
MKTALFAISVLIILAGCVSHDDKEITEIRANLEKQNAEISALRIELEKFDTSPENIAELRKEKMLDDAILLVRNCPDKCSNQAIQILGALGGEKAEAVLLDIAKNSTERKYRAALYALKNMKSGKLREIIMEELSKPELDFKKINALTALFRDSSNNIFQKEDIPLMEKLLSGLDKTASGNSGYLRSIFIRMICELDEKKGVELLCKKLSETSIPEEKRKLISGLGQKLSLSVVSWEKITAAVGSPQDNRKALYEIVLRMAASGDWRMTNLIIKLINLTLLPPKLSYYENYVKILSRLKDPKAAKTLLSLCGNSQPYNSCLDNYPGIKKDGSKYVLVDDETMKKLMEKRAEKIEYLNEIDKKKGN